MNFKDVFIDSLSYPFTDLKRFLILIVLFLGSFLLIPVIITLGYTLRIIEHSLKGEKGLPNFSDLWELLINGIKLIIINLIYEIPVILVTILLLKQIDFNVLSANLFLLAPMNMIIFIVIGFLVSLVYVTGVANMVHEKFNFMAAFDFKKIFNLIKMTGWKKYIAYIVVYSVIINILSLNSLYLIIPHSSTAPFALYGSLVLVINYLLTAYKDVFGSRFKGLIYPLEMKEEE
jgi:hypothetical protein